MNETVKILQQLFNIHSCSNAYRLEELLRKEGYQTVAFAKGANMLAAISATVSSATGQKERNTNMFDAMFEAGCRILNLPNNTTVDVAASYFGRDGIWKPDSRLSHIPQPLMEINFHDNIGKHRYKKQQPKAVCNLVFTDCATGVSRVAMPSTILNVHGSHKNDLAMTMGKYGQGGASAFEYCDISLIASVDRFGDRDNLSFTLVVPRKPAGAKQIREYHYFVGKDGLPLSLPLSFFPNLSIKNGGTIVAHYSYDRGNWVVKGSSHSRDNHYSQISLDFFSYPLPVTVIGIGLNSDAKKNNVPVPIKGAYWRLLQNDKIIKIAPYVFDLVVEGENYGKITVNVFLCENNEGIKVYVPKGTPIVYTCKGIKHGFDTVHYLTTVNLPAIYHKLIVEICIGDTHKEALAAMVTNSRETMQDCQLKKEVLNKVLEFLKTNDELRQYNDAAEAASADLSSHELNDVISEQMQELLNEGEDTCDPDGKQHNCDVKVDGKSGGTCVPAEPIPPHDPPYILFFSPTPSSNAPIKISLGSTRKLFFRTDARPPKYTFANGLLNCSVVGNAQIVSSSEISKRGTGLIELQTLTESKPGDTGSVTVTIQTAQEVLTAKVDFIVCANKAEPHHKERKSKTKMHYEVRVHGGSGNVERLTTLLGGSQNAFPVHTGYPPQFDDFEALNTEPTYTCVKGNGKIIIDVNANAGLLVDFMEKVPAKERRQVAEQFILDIACHATQHISQTEGTSKEMFDAISSIDDMECKLAENSLNFVKSIKLLKHQRKNK